MNDLNGLDWTSTSSNTTSKNKLPPPTSSLHYPGLRPVPSPGLSGRSTPLTAQPPSKPPTPANDSFANLVSFNSTKTSTNLSLQARQKQLAEERENLETQRKRQYDQQFGRESHWWDTLGSGNSTPELHHQPSSSVTRVSVSRVGSNGTFARTIGASRESAYDDDLLSAFDSTTPVGRSSHFPPQTKLSADRSFSERAPRKAAAGDRSAEDTTISLLNDGGPMPETFVQDDDDPFGLGQLTQKEAGPAADTALDEGEDILGVLGQPVSMQSPTAAREELGSEPVNEARGPLSASATSQDKAIADLVDMGFAANMSKRALGLTETGTDVQAAVGILLNQAHQEAREKTKANRNGERRITPERNGITLRAEDASQRPRAERSGEPMAPWMRQQDMRSDSSQRRQDSRSPALGEKDVAQFASELGSTLFKSANSLWKTGQKKVQKVVAELQHEVDASQPKWMREAHTDGGHNHQASRSSSERRQGPVDELRETGSRISRQPGKITEEAMMLESGGQQRPQRSGGIANEHVQASTVPEASLDAHLAALGARSPRQQVSDRPPLARLSRQEVEEQSYQAYVSPARRKRPMKPVELESDRHVDLFSAPPPSHGKNHKEESSSSRSRTSTPVPKPSAPLTTRPKPPDRQIPPVSSADLSKSHHHRQAGNAAFKRGDYDSAHREYTNALQPLPSSHPLTIVLLANRALTALKTGDPKAAVADADEAITVIGPGHGDGETVSIGPDECAKSMKDFYGKALMRKAEALEHMEKWTEAAAVWRIAVEAGVGGSVSIQGRDRSEKAVAPRPALSTPGSSAPANRPSPAITKKPKPKSSALSDLSGTSSATAYDAEAVKRLRAANAAAEKADDEKFALSDAVEARINAWKGGKSDNLRALLGSLDTILWPEAGWKKVGMNELVVPSRVKIVYMKAIGKVHPDKIPQTATTEQRMISGAVFSILNEAWDKFRRDNGL